MSKLTRVTAKVFGATADGTLADPEIGQFGSAKAGTYVGTGDVATIQNLSAWSNGWIDAVTPTQQFPTLPERTGVDKVLSYQNAYVLQQGIPEWDSATDYYTNGFCSKNGKIYFSKTDNNVNHDPETDTVNWEEFTSGGGSRNIGEIVQSTIPLTDAGLHLLDGSLLAYGSYSVFVDYIAGLVTDYPNLFTTEASWQDSVTNYGVCGKFVYDSVNNTVRLPKVTGFTEGASGVTNLGDLTQAGLPNITGEWHSNPSSGTANEQVTDTSPTDFVDGGAITKTTKSYYSMSNTTTSGTFVSGFSFDASDSNSIYGNSTTVQPQSIKVLYYIVVATSTKTDIEVNIDEIATDLNGKADVDLGNVTNTSGFRKLVELYNNGTSWYKVFREYNPQDGSYIGLWCEQGGQTPDTASATQTKTATLYPSFKDTNYFAVGTTVGTGTYAGVITKTTTSVAFYSVVTAGNLKQGVLWYACGYIEG